MPIDRFGLIAALAAVALLGLTACASDGSPAARDQSGTESATGQVLVVATTTILGDIAGSVVECAGGRVQTLMPSGADPHDFAPSSQQVAAMVSADLVVANGLGLEAGLTDALENAQADGAVVLQIAPAVDPIAFGHDGADNGGEHTDGHTDGHAEGPGDLDPHVWFDMTRMAKAATIIGKALADSTGDSAYTTCGTTVSDEILQAEVGVRATLESVPVGQRVLVTDHEALGYLANAYGYRIAGTVIPAGTTLAEPSSADLAALARTIRDEHVQAIFTNTSSGTALADAVAAEAGVDVSVIPLQVESLGAPGSGTDSYIGMMQSNATAIADGLRG